MIQDLLGLAALVLSVVNGLILLWQFARDKPKLTVAPVHPTVYQWWFRLPDGQFKGEPTRKYGFLAYVEITNKGLRQVSFQSWKLQVSPKRGGRALELDPISIPQPEQELGNSGHIKHWPVLGQKTISFEGNTLVDSGTSVSGIVYYQLQVYGSKEWNPKIENEKITGVLKVTDVFGKQARCKITFRHLPFEEVSKIVQNLEMIDQVAQEQTIPEDLRYPDRTQQKDS